MKKNRKLRFRKITCPKFIAAAILFMGLSNFEMLAKEKKVEENFLFKSPFSEKIFQQKNVSVSGMVKDENGEPLPGASVVVKGTTMGTITNESGFFEISNVKEGETLVFSFIGFETVEIPVIGRVVFDVVLKSSLKELNEIVVVGASLQQRDLTGAVVSVDDEVLEERPVTNINEALQGRATGVRINTNPEPGGDASIRVRGINSMHYSGNPIFVVDGIVMERDFDMININDVASINVLKDASATALYGSRGANGVIVITTKKGTRGKGKITYDAWFGIKSFANKSLTIGARDVFDLRVDALMNAESVGGNYFDLNPGATKNDFIEDVILADGSNWVADYEKESLQNDKSYNWLDEVTRSAFEQNHTISFSGSTENSNYYLSFGYTDEEGIVVSSNYKRYTGRINAEQKIKSWVKVGTNTSFTKSIDDLVDGSVFGVARGANPLLPIDEEYLYLAWGQNWDINSENPLRSTRIDMDRIKSRIYSSNYLNIIPNDKLNFRSTFAIDHTDQQYYEL